MNHLNFYEVLEILLVTKERIKARREKWSNMYVVAIMDPVLEKKVLELHTRSNKHTNSENECDFVISRWSPNSDGLLADDWIIEYK